MSLDLFSDILISSSMFYLYIGLLLMIIGMSYVLKFQQRNWMSHTQFFVDQHKNIKINIDCIEKPVVMNESFIEWIILIFKRIDERDDKEASTFSYFNHLVKIRGGRTWSNITYSPLLKNIAF
jgi:hypothetical protein